MTVLPVVLFMQENRAFDHVGIWLLPLKLFILIEMVSKYFGTMAGVRGFGDPNVLITSEGKPSWYQYVNPIKLNLANLALAGKLIAPFRMLQQHCCHFI